MLRKITCSLALVALCATTALAGQTQQNVGCGLGTFLWKAKSDNSLLSELLAGITNDLPFFILNTQHFGMTTGTLNCNKPASIVQNEHLNQFVAANMDGLAQDMARGRGESLDAYAELMGIPAEKRPAFNLRLQQNFSAVYPSERVAMADVINNTMTVIAGL